MNNQEFIKKTRTYINGFCKRYDYPEEATATFLDTFDKIARDEKLSKTFFRTHKIYRYFLYVNLFSPFADKGVCVKVAKAIGVSRYTVDFLFLLCLIPTLQRYYEKRGIPLSVFYDSMLDFRCKLLECKKKCDVWGTFVATWYPGFFYLGRFAIGRLQYEPIPTHFKYKLDFNGIKTNKFSKYLNIHIPSAGPLTPALVEDSFRRAYTFFRGRGYGKNVIYFTSSWLLSPDHKEILPADSNIVKFGEYFRPVYSYEEKGNGDFWRIFYRDFNPENPDTRGDTALQKGYARLIAEGKNIKHVDGVFVFNGKEFFK